jgi:uncharacterized protein with von Willebrand factor type A (vWA) domain
MYKTKIGLLVLCLLVTSGATAVVMHDTATKREATRQLTESMAKATAERPADLTVLPLKTEAFAPEAVMFLVDVSGSMMSPLAGAPWYPIDKTKIRAYAARKLAEKRLDELRKIRPDLEAGLCLFDDSTYEVCRVDSKLDEVHKQLMLIETINHSGVSDLYGRSSYSRGGSLLEAERILLSERPDLARKSLVVVITDEGVDQYVDKVSDAALQMESMEGVSGVSIEVHKVR